MTEQIGKGPDSWPTAQVGKALPDSSRLADGRKRIPLSIPQRKLEVPEIEGFSLYWFLESRVARAIQGGYVFVDDNEVSLNQHGIATSSELSGNNDMGTRVSVLSGQGADGKPESLVLMKIKREWWEEDQKALKDRNDDIARTIRTGGVGKDKEAPEDVGHRYVKSNYRVPQKPNTRRT